MLKYTFNKRSSSVCLIFKLKIKYMGIEIVLREHQCIGPTLRHPLTSIETSCLRNLPQALRPAPMAQSARLWLETQMYCGLESRTGRIFVIGVVHIQCFKLLKGLECTVLPVVLCTIKNPWSHSLRVGRSPDFGLPFVAILQWLCRTRHKAIFIHSQALRNSSLCLVDYWPTSIEAQS